MFWFSFGTETYNLVDFCVKNIPNDLSHIENNLKEHSCHR